MGQCQNLSIRTKACNIWTCVASVFAPAATSRSPSQIVLFKLQPGSEYNGHPISAAFAKIFIALPKNEDEESDSDDEENEEENEDGEEEYHDDEKKEEVEEEYSEEISLEDYVGHTKGNVRSLRQLNYDLQVYDKITNVCLDYNLSPGFVRMLAKGEKCSNADIVNLLSVKKNEQGEQVTPTKARIAAFSRAWQTTIDNHLLKATSARDLSSVTLLAEKNLTEEERGVKLFRGFSKRNQKLKFNVIVNELLDFTSLNPKVETLKLWFQREKKNHTKTWGLVWLCLYNFFVMDLVGLSHKDLHFENAAVVSEVEESEEKKDTLFVCEDEQFAFKMYECVKFFDWDHAVVKGWNTKRPGVNGKFIPNFDVIRFFRSFWKTADVAMRQTLLDGVLFGTNDDYFKNDFVKFCETRTASQKRLVTSFLKKHSDSVPSVYTLLVRVADLANIQHEKVVATPLDASRYEQVYRCSHQMVAPPTKKYAFLRVYS